MGITRFRWNVGFLFFSLPSTPFFEYVMKLISLRIVDTESSVCVCVGKRERGREGRFLRIMNICTETCNLNSRFTGNERFCITESFGLLSRRYYVWMWRSIHLTYATVNMMSFNIHRRPHASQRKHSHYGLIQVDCHNK